MLWTAGVWCWTLLGLDARPDQINETCERPAYDAVHKDARRVEHKTRTKAAGASL